MTTLKNDFDSICDYLNDLDNSESVNIHNTYCQENQYEDEIYENDDEFFNTFFDGKVIEAVRAVSYGEYNYTDSYVQFNGYGNLESFGYPDERIDFGAIANDILENPERYNIELEDNED